MSVPLALIRAAVELGLNQDWLKDSCVAWLTIYTSTGVDPNDMPRLAAEQAIGQLTADVVQHLQLTPLFQVPAAPQPEVQVYPAPKNTRPFYPRRTDSYPHRCARICLRSLHPCA